MPDALKIGIAGLGTVGCSVVRLLTRQAQALAQATGRSIEIVAVSARDRTRPREMDVSGYAWVEDAVTLARDPRIDVFVELIGGSEGTARQAVEAALQSGKSVVTANKALLAHHGMMLAEMAESRRLALNFEAAVAGGIPVIKTLREAMVGNRIGRVAGILNGTCNYILTRMAEEGLDFDTCLSDAQRLGYAEADPTFDIDGWDSAHKLALLTSLAFGTRVNLDAIHVEGIRSITALDFELADQLGYRIRLLGVASRTDTGIEQRVHPTMLPKSATLARVDGVLNAVDIEGDAVRIALVGPGAGGDATASAVVADIADLARGHRTAPFLRPVQMLDNAGQAPMREHEGGYYIRLAALDRPGTAAAIATRMSEQNISLEQIIQRRRADTSEHGAAPVVLVTYATTEEAVRRALTKIELDGVIAAKPQLIRIETER